MIAESKDNTVKTDPSETVERSEETNQRVFDPGTYGLLQKILIEIRGLRKDFMQANGDL